MTAYVLLTGATGFLGTQVARQLLTRTDTSIIALVRAENLEAARQRLRREWWDWPELVAAIDNRIDILNGDLCLQHPRAKFGSLPAVSLSGDTHPPHRCRCAPVRLAGQAAQIT